MSGMMISTHFIEVKMNLEKIKEKLIPFLEPKGLDIYSIRIKRAYGEKIVEILIDVETMDIDELEKIHMAFIETLDDDDLDDDYFLELSSLGAERPLKTLEDLKKVVGRYIYFVSPQFKGNGTLIELKEDILVIEINDKGRLKKIEIPFHLASRMRTAVKL